MSVLVDTSIWSLAFRRDTPRGTAHEKELLELIRDGRVVMLGAVRQELLSGIRAPEQFRKLRDRLRAFPDVALGPADHEEAASCFNRCRSRGLQGSNTDFLLCAVALRLDVAIFTIDGDFTRFVRVLHVKLHEAPR